MLGMFVFPSTTNSNMDYRTFHVCMWSFFHAYMHTRLRFIVSYEGQKTFVKYRVCTEFWLQRTHPQSACKAQHKMVTHPCGDHAQSCLSMAFESECFCCVPVQMSCCSMPALSVCVCVKFRSEVGTGLVSVKLLPLYEMRSNDRWNHNNYEGRMYSC